MSDTSRDQRGSGAASSRVTAKAFDSKGRASLMRTIDPVEYHNYFHSIFQNAPYYSTGREWGDYEPAYDYGYASFGQYRGQRFEDVEDVLERHWGTHKGQSRLAWAEAKGAVRDGWLQIERSLPAEVDRDLR